MALGHTDLFRTLMLERFYSSNIFNAVPKDKSDFRPQEDLRTAAELLAHIGAFDDFLFQGLKHGNWAVDVFTDRPEKTVEEALAYTEHSRNCLMALIDELQDEGLLAPIGPNPAFSPQMGVSNVILTALAHECHHRGQLTTYLRLMGITPPALNDPA